MIEYWSEDITYKCRAGPPIAVGNNEPKRFEAAKKISGLTAERAITCATALYSATQDLKSQGRNIPTLAFAAFVWLFSFAEEVWLTLPGYPDNCAFVLGKDVVLLLLYITARAPEVERNVDFPEVTS